MQPDGDLEDIAEAQVLRKAALEKYLQAPLVLPPVQAGGHWTLLVLHRRGAETWRCRYYDSLTVESDLCRETAHEVLQHLGLGDLQLPARENQAFQTPGSNTCGSYVLHWVEAEVREHCLKEGPCSAGWPEAKQRATRLHRLGRLLQTERKKVAEEETAAATLQEKLAELKAGFGAAGRPPEKTC